MNLLIPITVFVIGMGLTIWGCIERDKPLATIGILIMIAMVFTVAFL